MAVYRRGYQRYQGPITGRWARFMVLPRFAWRRLFQQRLVVLLMVVAMIWPLLCAGFIYLTNHAELLKGLAREFQSFIEVNGKFFLIFMNVQAVFAIFLAALTGPGLIAPDLANNALPLYFSRPLTRSEYALARLISPVRHAFADHLGSGTAAVRHAGGHGRQMVVPGELDDRLRHRRRFRHLDPAGEHGGAGQFRLREMEDRGRRAGARLSSSS